MTTSFRSGYFCRSSSAARKALCTEPDWPDVNAMCSRSPFCSSSSKNAMYVATLIWLVWGSLPSCRNR